MVTQESTQPEGVGNAIKQALKQPKIYAARRWSLQGPGFGVKAPIYTDRTGLHPIPATVFDEYLTGPSFRRAPPTSPTSTAFIEHANRFKSEASVVFANDSREKPSLTSCSTTIPPAPRAILRSASTAASSTFRSPTSGRRGTTTTAKRTRSAWSASLSSSKIALSTSSIPPTFPSPMRRPRISSTSSAASSKVASPIKLLELSRGLSINENSVISQNTKLQSGEGHITFSNEHIDTATGLQVDIPSMFVITIPVFRNGACYRILARLRYRVSRASPSGTTCGAPILCSTTPSRKR
jgi:hypothetical protein